jgi:predicted acylesterase/phospholipase RssA
LRHLLRDGIPLEVIVGVSAGAIIAGYYAAVGVDIDDLIADARTFRGRHLLAHSLNVRLSDRFGDALRPLCGVIPNRLIQLEAASFGRLRQGVWRLGIACHDITTGQPCYFATGDDEGVALPDVVKASASIPGLFPAIRVTVGGRQRALIDGGISDPVPMAFARRLGATHLIVSDARWLGTARRFTRDVVWIRPRMASTGTLWAPRQSLTATVEQGDAAVTDEVISEIRAWLIPGRNTGSQPPGAAA